MICLFALVNKCVCKVGLAFTIWRDLCFKSFWRVNSCRLLVWIVLVCFILYNVFCASLKLSLVYCFGTSQRCTIMWGFVTSLASFQVNINLPKNLILLSWNKKSIFDDTILQSGNLNIWSEFSAVEMFGGKSASSWFSLQKN